MLRAVLHHTENIYYSPNNLHACSIKYEENLGNKVLVSLLSFDGKRYDEELHRCATCKRLFIDYQDLAYFKDAYFDYSYQLAPQPIPDEILKLKVENQEISYADKVSMKKIDCSLLVHQVVASKVQVRILNRNCEISKLKVKCNFCLNCNTYSIRKSEYEKLCCIGTPLFQYFDEEQIQESIDDGKNLMMMVRSTSKLRQLGYNVSNDGFNISSRYRKKLLDILILEEVVSAEEIKKHLTMLINLRKNQEKFKGACECWNDDLSYIINTHIYPI